MQSSAGTTSPARAIVYPELLPDLDWIKHSLLFWDELKHLSLSQTQSVATGELGQAYKLGLITPILTELSTHIEQEFVSGIDIPSIAKNLHDLDVLAETLNLLRDHLLNFGKQPITVEIVRRYPNEFLAAARFLDNLRSHTSERKPYVVKSKDDTLVWLGPAFILLSYFTSLITKHSSSLGLGTLSSHERLTVLSQPRILATDGEYTESAAETQVLTQLEIPYPKLEDTSSLSFDRIAKFRESTSDQRSAFRQVVNEIAAGIPQDAVPERIAEYYRDRSTEITKALSIHAQDLKQFGWGTTVSILKVGTTTFIPSSVAPLLLDQPVLASIAGGLSLVIAGMHCYHDQKAKWRKFIKDHPVHYLYQLKKLR